MPLPTKPPLSPKHTEERLKYAATGLQTFAFTLFVGVLIGPALNCLSAFVPPTFQSYTSLSTRHLPTSF